MNYFLPLLFLILLSGLPSVKAVCGDSTCSSDESPSTCPEDCGLCGNGICDFDQFEDGHYCPQDCKFFLETFTFGNDYVKWVPSSAPDQLLDIDGDVYLSVTFPARTGTDFSGYFSFITTDWDEIASATFRGGFFYYELQINQAATSQSNYPDFIIYSSSNNAYLYFYFSSSDYAALSDNQWHSVSIDLEEPLWYYQTAVGGTVDWATGRVSTAADWDSFNGHVSQIYIKGQFSNNGNYVANLDNLQLAPEGTAGICVPISCGNRQCGSDGCGTECGTGCAIGTTCSSSGTCVPTGCVPSCTGKNCGDNGCGGSCGTCSGSQQCVNGVCSTVCTPTCSGRNCGDNGCGGSCGSCLGTDQCINGVCTVVCTPSCSGRNCGDNGCGGSCGTCSGSDQCINGVCTNICTPNCSGRNCGDNGCGGSCGSCSGSQQCSNGVCINICTPNCSGRNCGDNGCGGSCGTCSTGKSCNSAGQCVTFCGDGLCDPSAENINNCPKDCQVCGDGFCSGNETRTSCPTDCSNICGNGACEAGETPSNCAGDCPGCGDRICDAARGETVFTCQEDCGTCGDHVCDFNTEDSRLCPEDCGYCGNGVCEAEKGENQVSCEVDCGASICGDGRCTAGESTQTCPADCVPPQPNTVNIVLNFAGLIPAQDCCTCCGKK